MTRNRVSPVTIPNAEAFTADIEARFTAFQQNNEFRTRRLTREEALKIIRALSNPGDQVLSPEQLKPVEFLYTVIDGQLYEKHNEGVKGRRQRRVIFDAGELFGVVAAVHLQLGHAGTARTINEVKARYAGIDLRESEWVAEHCRGCHPLRSPPVASAATAPASNADAVGTPTTTLQPIVGFAQGNQVSNVNSSHAGPTTPGGRIHVGTLSVFIPSIAEGHLVLIISAGPAERAVLFTLPAFTPDSIAAVLAYRALFAGWPQHARFEETILGDLVLRRLEEGYGVRCGLGPTLPLRQTTLLTDMVRELIVAYFRRTPNSDWESARMAVNSQLNLAGPPTRAVHDSFDETELNSNDDESDEE